MKIKMRKATALFLAFCSTAALLCSCDNSNKSNGLFLSSNGPILLTEENKDTVKYTVSQAYEYKTPAKYYMDNFGEDVMPILGFWGPYKETYYQGSYLPSLQTLDMYKDIKESGVNIIMQNNDSWGNNREAVINSFELCAQVGLGYIVADWDLANISGTIKEDTSSYEKNQEIWNERIAMWNEYDSFAGIYVKDEPTTVAIDSIGAVMDLFHNALEANNIESKIALCNAFPSGYISAYEGISYAEHLKAWAEKGKVDYLSWDYYAFEHVPKDNLGSGFFSNIAEVYNAAKLYNLPFSSYVQCGGNWVGNSVDLHTGVCPPTMEQVIWEANVFLAYGAKGISYFTLNMPHSFFQYLPYDGVTGIFDPWGNRTKYFYAAKQVNEQIAATDHILMNTNHHGMILKGALPGEQRLRTAEIHEDSFRQLISVNDDCTALIGCMDYYGKTVLFVMNSSYYEKTEVTLNFDDTYCYDVTQRAELVSVVGKSFTLKLTPGESALVVLR